MTTLLRRPEPPSVNGSINGSKNGKAVKARAEAVAASRPPRQPSRRRLGRTAVGVAGALIGCWVFASLYMSAGHHSEALLLTRSIHRYDVIQRTDLKSVQIASNTEAAHIPATQLDQIVGRTAGTDLIEGSLIVEGQLMPTGGQVLRADEAIVGVLLAGGDVQVGLLKGSKVSLVIRTPQASGVATTVEVPGWVYSTPGEASASRERSVEVAVPRSQAAMVSAAGADKRVTIIMLAA